MQRAIGARSPSLAVATTMHHFSVASLVALSEVVARHGVDAAGGHRRRTTCWSRPGSPRAGRAAASCSPRMQATATATACGSRGVKRPCSLARSMDLLTASVRVPRLDGTGTQLAVALIPAASEGIAVSRRSGARFALAGAESDQVSVDRRAGAGGAARPHRAAGRRAARRRADRRVPVVRAADDGVLPRRGVGAGRAGAGQRPRARVANGPPGGRPRGRHGPRSRTSPARSRPPARPRRCSADVAVRPLRRAGRHRPGRARSPSSCSAVSTSSAPTTSATWPPPSTDSVSTRRRAPRWPAPCWATWPAHLSKSSEGP